jgi:hypothetical protein
MEGNVLMLREMRSSDDDLKRHVRSGDYRNVLLVTEMAIEPPEIKFQTVSHSAGIEIIEKARGYTRE